MSADRTLRAFDQLKRSDFAPAPAAFQTWDPGSLRKELLLACTPTLREWLTARCGELVYQKINRDRVDFLVRGAQVIVRVDKVQRFAFKIKISLGE